jgi:tungstate transport system permease protein
MDLLIDGFKQAFWLLIQGDPQMVAITLLSLAVSLTATAISLVLGILIGTGIGLTRFWGRGFVISLINTGMGAPPVVVGLIVSIFLWRSGPLGFLHIIYSPTAMVIAQIIIALPIVIGFTVATIQQVDAKLRLQILALGASRSQFIWLLLREMQLPLLAAVMAGFGSIISEVGASQMVGGSIQDQTRVLTTAIMQQVSKGDFGLAIALSIVLMIIVYIVNALLTIIQQRGRVP